jgi:hypothetical protein
MDDKALMAVETFEGRDALLSPQGKVIAEFNISKWKIAMILKIYSQVPRYFSVANLYITLECFFACTKGLIEDLRQGFSTFNADHSFQAKISGHWKTKETVKLRCFNER